MAEPRHTASGRTTVAAGQWLDRLLAAWRSYVVLRTSNRYLCGCARRAGEQVLRHMVGHPARIGVDSHTLLAPMTIAVDVQEGVRTVITIEREPEIIG